MLTKEQEEVKNNILQYINNDIKNTSFSNYIKSTIALTGAAGTGKTFLIKEIVKEILYSHHIRIISPTHQALSVISNNFEEILTLQKGYTALLNEFSDKYYYELIYDYKGNNIIRKEISPTSHYKNAVKHFKDTEEGDKLLKQYNLKEFPNPIDIRLSTIHSLLGVRINLIKEEIDIENLEFDKLSESKLYSKTVIIADEASMLSKKLLDLLFKEAYASKSKIIFIGDPYQLPPVNERNNGVFNVLNRKVYTLNEVIRTKKQDITIYTNDLRAGKYYIPKESDNIRIIQKNKYKYDDNIILAYTNKAVDDWNNNHKLFHHNDLKFKTGDLIRLLRPVGTYTNSTMFTIDKIDVNYEMKYDNSIFSKLLEITTIPCVELQCTKAVSENIESTSFYIMKDNNQYCQIYNKLVDKLQKASNIIKYRYSEGVWIMTDTESWLEPHLYNYEEHGSRGSDKTLAAEMLLDFKNKFLLYKDLETTINDNKTIINRDFQLANALTIHKSQGMSIQNVAVDYNNIFGNDSLSLTYVAMSRVVNRLTILI